MTARAIPIRARVGRSVDAQSLLFGLGVLLVCLVSLRLLTQPRELRLAFACGAVALSIGLVSASPRRLLFALVFWLTALGFVRRTLNLISPTPSTDVLLLVGPFAMALLFLVAARCGAFRHRTRLASAVLALNLITVLGAFNPLQGSIATGLAGLLFVLVPVLGFWVGRAFFDDRSVATLLKLFAVLSIPAAIYGLEQTFAGFPSWDMSWINAHATDYQAITVHGVPRAFANFSAASEYVTFLGVGLVVWISFVFKPVIGLVAVAAVSALAVAILYEGSRGIIVAGLVALAMMVLLLLPYAVTRIVDKTGTYGTPLVARQVQGLQHPGSDASTLPQHIHLLQIGIHSARVNPLGRGTGSVTIAGAKFGGVGSGSAEADPGNAAIAWGLPGLALYLFILVEALRKGYRLASLRRGWLAPAALAIIVLTALQWLNGGQYAVAFLPWLLLGWIDRSLMNPPEAAAEPEPG
jgi:hypothetical protein